MTDTRDNHTDLPHTGERYLPEMSGPIVLEHVHRYQLAQGLCDGKTVLDIASGEGYGSAMLASVAKSLIGVDISPEAVRHATEKYASNNLEFCTGSCDSIPVHDASVDVVVSFETIEHHDRHEEMFREIKRVLRPDGILIISSPDKHEYSDVPKYNNPYHVKELYREEFSGLIGKNFKYFALYGQRVVYGSGIFLENYPARIVSGILEENCLQSVGMSRPHYFIAIASDATLPELTTSFLEQAGFIADIERQVSRFNQTIAERDAQISTLDQAVAERDAQISTLDQAVAERDAQIAALYNSTSWRITRPVRWVGRIMRGEFTAAADPFKRFFKTNPRVGTQPPESAAESSSHDCEAMSSETARPSYIALSVRRDKPILGDPGILRDQTKLIAFYLPQFHRIKENSEWWGPGFTEWTNVANGRPNFNGHYQPHIPRELGFYDLSSVDVIYEQAELARRYGIHGFCFYYYWFSGRRILERPIDNFLTSDVDLPFCVCWANENWTRIWDGKENSVLLEQGYAEGDEEHFIHDLLPFFADHRYIRVDDRPMLLVYRIKQLPDPVGSIKKWRAAAEQAGLVGLHIAVVDFYDISDPREVGADALVEFPPHKFNSPQNHPDPIPTITNPAFTGGVVDYLKMIAQSGFRNMPDYTLYRGIVPGWDNTARRQDTSTIIINNTPDLYGVWLRYLRSYSRLANSDHSDSFIFVNAWNEWGEGCHLEPDIRWGLQFLEETARSSWFDGAAATLTLDEARERLLAEVREIVPREEMSDQADLTRYAPPSLLVQKASWALRRVPWLHQVGKRLYHVGIVAKRRV